MRIRKVALVAATIATTVATTAWAEVDHTSRFNAGAGFGMPYGMRGIAAEITPRGASIGDFGCFGFAVGAGTDDVFNYGSASARFYLIDRKHRTQVKFTLLGQGRHDTVWGDNDWDMGLGIGGVYHLTRSLALDADTFLRVNANDYVIAVGLRWHFY